MEKKTEEVWISNDNVSENGEKKGSGVVRGARKKHERSKKRREEERKRRREEEEKKKAANGRGGEWQGGRAGADSASTKSTKQKCCSSGFDNEREGKRKSRPFIATSFSQAKKAERKTRKAQLYGEIMGNRA